MGAFPRLVIYAAVLIALTGSVTLGELNELLKARHPPGAPSYGIGDLSGSPLRPDLHQVEEVVEDSWLLGASPDFTRATTIVHAHVIVDCVFALAYAGLLALLAFLLDGALKAASQNIAGVAAHRLSKRDVVADDEGIADELAELRPRVDRYRVLARRALFATPALFLVDVAENVLQSIAVENPREHWLYVPLYAATLLKFALLLLVLVALALGLLGLDMLHPRAKNRLAATFVVTRAPLILGALLVLAFMTDLTPFGEQSSDVLLSWKENRDDALVGVLVFAWLSVLTLVLARRLLLPTPETARAARRSELVESFLGRRPAPFDLRRPLKLLPLAAAGGALVIVGVACYFADVGGIGIGAAGGILLAIAGLSWLVGRAESGPLPVLGPGTMTLPALAAAAPLVVLGLALVKATVPEIAWAHREEYVGWALLGVGLQVSGFAVFAVGRSAASERLVARGWLVMAPTLVLLGYLVWRIWLHPWRVADALGAFGVLAVASGAALFVAYLLMWPEERLAPPSVFAVFRLRRIPVFVLVMIWALVAATLDQGGFHDVRPLKATGTPRPAGEGPGLSVEKAFVRWLRRNPAPAATGDERPARPLVLVAAAGGGVRAAYWTGLVLECVFAGRGADACTSAVADDAPEETVLAASGASGGSVGLASWVAQLRSDEGDWLDHLGDDSITPTLAWTLFVDVPNAFAKFEWFGDRAQILERTWEQQWGSRDTSIGDLVLPWRTGPSSTGPLAEGLFAATSDDGIPLLLLTATSVEDGCRFTVSALDSNVGLQRVGTRIEECLTMRSFEQGSGAYVDPKKRLPWALAASKDLDDYLCSNGDLRLSTAALLSARFPYVSPSGRLVKCGDEQQKTATYLVDGGYFDNTGSSPLVELWAGIEPLVTRYNTSHRGCIAPFVLEIDNHYGEPPGPEPDPRPKESQVPIQTLRGTRNAQEASSRQSAAVGASIPFSDDHVVARRGRPEEVVDRYARIYPRAHPGTRAPLGWALSEASRGDLRVELASAQNESEIEKARSWFRDDLVCIPAVRP